jgi:CheY-like chemotaxis protein
MPAAVAYKRTDDDNTFLDLARELLERDEQVFLVHDAGQAVQLATHLGFKVGLIDLDLKGKGGLSLMRKLRQSFPDLPIIAISSVLGEL